MADTAQLVIALGLKDNASAGLSRVSGQVSNLSRNLGRVGTGIGQVGHGLDQILTRGAIAAGAALVGVVGAAATFEQAFAGIVKTVDEADLKAVGLTFDDLRESILKMSREIPISANELARLGEAAGALGVNAEDIDDFIRVTALLGETTDITADEAASALGTLGNQLDLTGKDYERFGDILVNLGNKGASTESQILSFAERIAAAGNQAGLTVEQILGFASAMASVGLEAEAGGTAFSMTLNKLTLGIATGADEVKAFAKVAGLSVPKFAKLFKEDASGAVTLFLKNLGKLDRFEAARILEDAGITGVRQTDAIFRLAQGYDVLSDSLAVAEDRTKGLSIEAAKKFDTTLAKLEILKGSLTSSAIIIGDQLLPIITELATEFGELLNKPGTQSAIKAFAKDLAQGFRDFIAEIKGTDFSGLVSGIKIAADVAKGAFDLFNKLPPDIKALAIGALVVNKATGGAVGSIAKGLGNIVLGSLGGLLGRGASPALPVWVQSVTGGAGGVGGIPGGGGGVPLWTIGLWGAAASAGAAAGIWAAENQSEKFYEKQRSAEGGLELTQHAGLQAGGRVGGVVNKSLLAGLSLINWTIGQQSDIQRANLAWSERLSGQAEAIRAETANTAWSARLTGMAIAADSERLARANAASSARWEGLASSGVNISQLTADRMALNNQLLTGQGSLLVGIRDRPATPINLTIPVNVNLNASLIQSKVLQLQRSAGRGFTETF